MIKIPYSFDNRYILRTPLLSFRSLKAVLKNKYVSSDELKKLYESPLINEAIYLASPSLHEELNKLYHNKHKSHIKLKNKLELSFLKYLSRMSSRCTPFGLFAGCSVGRFDDETNIILLPNEQKYNKRHTKLDMNYLVSLTQDLLKYDVLRNQLIYYPNSSLYKIGNSFRYVEYFYKNNIRLHKSVSIDSSIYIERIINFCRAGSTLDQIVNKIVDEEISKNDAYQFINDLIDNQVLISELSPTLTGTEFLTHILNVLHKYSGTEFFINVLEEVSSGLIKLDQSFGNPVSEYKDYADKLSTMNTKVDLRYLYHLDLFVQPKANFLKKSIQNKIIMGINFLNKISEKPFTSNLQDFINAFYIRYGEREVPLVLALDVELGIGYPISHNYSDVDPLIDDLKLPNNSHAMLDIKWSQTNYILFKKISEAIRKNHNCINLKDEDFKGFVPKWDDLSPTISVLAEILLLSGEEKIKLDFVGGTSAANLLSRFSYGDLEISKLCKDIISFECNYDSNIHVEITHLPEARTGNILSRLNSRDYEIPYLANSTKEKDMQLDIEDLFISIKNGKYLSLKSKKHNKEVIPHLTNAHNYSFNSLPIYHFLCDLQEQNRRKYIGFELGQLTDMFVFIPRIEYNDLILREATWTLKKSDYQYLVNILDNEELFDEIQNWRDYYAIPQYILVVESDNELLINLLNINSIKMLLSIISQKDGIKLKEFFYNENGIVKEEKKNGYYTNQVIMSLYKSKNLKTE